MDFSTSLILMNIWCMAFLLKENTSPVFFLIVGVLWGIAGATGL